jgi:hypothetical protein
VPVPSIRIALCREQDVAPLMKFIGAEWQAGHVLSRDEELLRWQFDRSLLPGREFPGPTVVLAWYGDSIVGMFGLMGCRATLEGTVASAVWLCNWFASPTYRHLNVALGLWRAVEQLGFDVVATLGATPTSTKLLMALHFEAILALPRWIGVVNVPQTARLLADTNEAVGLDAAVGISERYRAEVNVNRLGAGDVKDAAVEVMPWRDDLAAGWDRFWTQQVAGRIVGTSRDARFICWRYARHPCFRYDIRLATRRSDGGVIGLAVYRAEQVRGRGETVLRVVEFLATPPASTALAHDILRAAQELGVAYADFYCSSAAAARALEQVGFKRENLAEDQPAFPTRLQPLEKGHFPMVGLLWLPSGLRGRLNTLVDEGRLYLTKADGDQDRPN